MAYQQSQFQRGFDIDHIPWGVPDGRVDDTVLPWGDLLNYIPWGIPVDEDLMPMPPPMPALDIPPCFGGFGQPSVYMQQHNMIEPGVVDRADRGGSFSGGSSAGGDTPYSGGSTQMETTRSNSVESFGSFGSGSDGPSLYPTRRPILQATPSPEVAIAVHTRNYAHSHSHSHSHSHKRRPTSPVSPSSSRGSISSMKGTVSPISKATSPISKATKGVGELGPRDETRRIRKKFSRDQKIETHMTRLEGACLRCWKNRKRVCFLFLCR